MLPPAPTNRFEQEGVDWDYESSAGANGNCNYGELPEQNFKPVL